MAALTTSENLFSPVQTAEIFSSVAGHSSLAKLSGQKPIPFTGSDVLTFSMTGEASIVGEGANKPAGDATFKTVRMHPVKFVYQHRVTEEFQRMAAEARVPYLQQFAAGFAAKLGRALDIAAEHGVNPADKKASTLIGDNCLDKAVTQSVTFDKTAPDDNLQAAVTTVQAADGVVTGMALSTDFASALGSLKDKNGRAIYEDFRFGAAPATFAGVAVDVNNTATAAGDSLAYVGDFQNAFRWGYAANLPIEVIPYGDPDGQGDLKQSNEIVLRAEAYIGWGILDPSAFAKIVKATAAAGK